LSVDVSKCHQINILLSSQRQTDEISYIGAKILNQITFSINTSGASTVVHEL